MLRLLADRKFLTEPLRDFQEGGTVLKEQLLNMSPWKRYLYIGAIAASVATYMGVVTAYGPMPGVRKTIAGLPEIASRDNREWFAAYVKNLTASMAVYIEAGSHRRGYAAVTAAALAIATTLQPVRCDDPESAIPVLPVIVGSDSRQAAILPASEAVYSDACMDSQD